jgi:hypothetical protein
MIGGSPCLADRGGPCLPHRIFMRLTLALDPKRLRMTETSDRRRRLPAKRKRTRAVPALPKTCYPVMLILCDLCSLCSEHFFLHSNSSVSPAHVNAPHFVSPLCKGGARGWWPLSMRASDEPTHPSLPLLTSVQNF